jgi:hypothetical protein
VVTQGAKSINALNEIRSFFDCGKVFPNRRHDNHHEDIYRLCIRSVKDLREKIVPFFERNRLRTAKADDFAKFKRVLGLMNGNVHLNEAGLARIKAIAETMNRKGMQKR